MSRNQPIDLSGGILTIESGQEKSKHIDMRRMPLRGITIFFSGTPTGTISIEVTASLDAEFPSVTTWHNLQSGGADVVVGADEAVPIDFVGWHGLRFSSSSSEGADRIFKIVGVEDI
jgi:hypothetical protein